MRKLVEQGNDIEQKYSHLFDKLIIYTDHDTAYQELVATSRRLKEDFQWIPYNWVTQ